MSDRHARKVRRNFSKCEMGVPEGRFLRWAILGSSQFAAGELDVLVATTLIEVGVNMPNATVMVVLEAICAR